MKLSIPTFLLFAIKLANLKLNIIVINIVGIHSKRSSRFVNAIFTYSNCIIKYWDIKMLQDISNIISCIFLESEF